MKRLLGIGSILATAAAVASASGAHSAQAEPGGMLLIGVGLVLTASLTRHKIKSR